MPRVIRTLHVDTELTWRGGEQQALYLATGLARRGQVAEVLGNPGSEFLCRAKAAGLETHELRMRREFNPLAYHMLRMLLIRRQFDIIHAHTSHAHVMSGSAALWLRSCRVVVSRRVDFSIRRPPLHPGRLKYRRGIDRFIAISRAVRDVLVDGGVRPERIHIVPSGIDLERLEGVDPERLRKEFKLSPRTRVIGAVAHFAWHKGLEFLVEAAPTILARYPDTRIFLVGDGEKAEELKEQAARIAPPGTIVFPGFRADAPSFLSLFDVVVTPSVMEGLNTTNLDALALGRPLVATAVGGIPEAVIDGETGLLVPPREPDRLAQAILRLLDDRELAIRLGKNGRQLVEERFTCDAMVDGTLAVYRDLLGPE